MEKLSDLGCISMKELTEFDDVWDGRNQRNRRQESARFEVNKWVGLLLLNWAGEDWAEVDWERRQPCQCDMLTSPAFIWGHCTMLST